MTTLLLQTALSNVCLSLILALMALAVQAIARRPHLAYFLWLLVFVKLLTPTLVTVPVVPLYGQPARAIVMARGDSQPTIDEKIIHGSGKIWTAVREHAPTGFLLIWLLGSMLILAWSLERVYRFNRLLKLESTPAPPALQGIAAGIANQLGLKTAPTIHTTSAHLSPMVWWIGGKVQIIVPAALVNQMDAGQMQWILAHELAHVRRRDYLVRWIEWLACACFWWNPVVYWARSNLRATEEICCDALVVGSLKPKPHTYAESLLTAVEYLACPAIRPPAIASAINSGGHLERRFKMIVSGTLNRKASRWLQVCVLLFAAVVLPLGVASAQTQKADPGVAETRIKTAVADGKMTPAEGRVRLQALKQANPATAPKTDTSVAETRIKNAIAAGTMTPAEGRAKLQALKQQQAKPAVAPKTDTSVAEARIKQAIADGKMTPAEGRAKLQELRQAKPATTPKTDTSVAETRIKNAIAAGKMTPAEGRAKLQEIRQIKPTATPKADPNSAVTRVIKPSPPAK